MELQKVNQVLRGGGGVIRDMKGRVLYAYGSLYGVRSNLWSEAKSGLEGLQRAQQLGFTHIWLELDSSTLIGMIKDRSKGVMEHLGSCGVY